MRRLVLLAPLALLVLGTCTYVRDPAPYRPAIPPAPEGVATGAFLYQRDCAWCHADEGRGTRRGPDITTDTGGAAFTDFMLRSGRMPIDSPDQYVRRSPSIYTDAEIDAIVEHVESFDPEGPEIPRLHPEEGEMSVGLELYEENCAACHSTTGAGGALAQGAPADPEGRNVWSSGFVAPGLGAPSARETAEAVIVGPGTMPPFEGTFTEHELDSLVRYVLYLQEPEDRGGASIGRIGPVAEGAVAWVVGLGALLLLSMWIGTRTRSS